MTSLQSFNGHVQYSQVISHKERIKLGLFEFLDEICEMLKVEIGIWIRARISPCAGVQTDRSHERCEMQLFGPGSTGIICYLHTTRIVAIGAGPVW